MYKYHLHTFQGKKILNMKVTYLKKLTISPHFPSPNMIFSYFYKFLMQPLFNKKSFHLHICNTSCNQIWHTIV